MNAASIRSRPAQPRAKPDKSSGKSDKPKVGKPKAKKPKAKRAAAPAALESIAHLRQRELAAYCGGGRSAPLSDQREVESITVPGDGTYITRYWRVDLAEGNAMIDAMTLQKAQRFERAIWNSSRLEVGTGLDDTARGWHAIGFVADPTLKPPSTSGGTTPLRVNHLPSSIEEMTNLEHFEKRRIHERLTVNVDSLFMHKMGNYEPFRIPGVGENHPETLVSPGWWVYVAGGFTNQFDSVVTTIPPMKVVHKYKVTLIEPTPVRKDAGPVRHETSAAFGVPLPLIRAAAAAVGKSIAVNLRPTLGYDQPQTLADIAAAEQLHSVLHFDSKANDGDLFTESQYSQLIQGLVGIATGSGATTALTGYLLQRAARPLGTAAQRDVTQYQWYKMLHSIKLSYDIPSVGGTISQSVATTGRLLTAAVQVYCATKANAVFPQDYTAAWTSATTVSRTGTQAPWVVGSNPAITPLYAYTRLRANGTTAEFEAQYKFGSSYVLYNQRILPSTLDTGMMIRPWNAYVDRSSMTGDVPTSSVAVGSVLQTANFGLRDTDVVQTFFTLTTYVASGDPSPPPVLLENVEMLGFDLETNGSNDGRRYHTLSDLWA